MFGRHSGFEDGWYREACHAAREAARHGRRHHGGFGPGGFEAPFGRFPFGRFPFGGGPRARRGDVRGAILALLAEQPRNGYQIMQELEKRSRSLWRPSPGSVYPALQQLQDEGLIEEKAEGTGRTFSLTEAGRAYVREHPDEVRAPWEDADEEDDARGRELFGSLRDTAVALWQISTSGSAAQRAEARRLLEETRRALHRILAGEGGRRDV
ncbi:MAG TPA: PadR family transcriptional regulator [Vicinamibacteria bacterium]|nr:PadR family transcriptional regulator [Vicinamibacteria bacterium]